MSQPEPKHPSSMPPRRLGGLLTSPSALFLTWSLGVLLTAAVDLVYLSASGWSLVGGAWDWLRTIGSTVSVLAVWALPLLALELVAARVARSRPRADGPAAPRAALAPVGGAVVLGGLVFLGLTWVKEFLFELHYIERAYDRVRDIAVIFTTMNLVLSVLVLVLAVGVGAGVWRLLTWFEARRPGGSRAAFLVSAIVAAVLVTLATAAFLVLERQFVPPLVRGAGALALVVGGQVIAVLLLLGLRPLASRWRQALIWGVAAVLLLGLLSMSDRGSAARWALRRQSVLVGAVIRAASGPLDFDGDGYPGGVLGADCDDWDPGIHPGSPDLPGDGVDQNCTGADAILDEGTGRIPLPAAQGPQRPLRVVWIVVDSLRADRLAGGGYHRTLTPHLDAFAERSVVFSQARSQSDNTSESFPSFLGSQYPSYFLRVPPEPELNHTMASILAAQGYQTGVVTPIRLIPDYALAGFGVAKQDISHRHSFVYGVTSVPVTVSAEELLRQWHGSPFFLLVHYYDPHGAYIPHERFYFGGSSEDAYDSEVAYTDHFLGKLLALLEENGFLDDTIVVIHADHGDSFGEHGNVAHGGSLFDEVVHVPLLLYVPGMPPRRVDDPVGLVDVMPTLLDVMGLPDPGRLQGRSLRALLEGGALPRRPVFFESNYPGNLLYGVYDDGRKLLWDVKSDALSMFDLRTDPLELTNIVSASGEERDRLLETLNGFRDAYLHAPLFRGPLRDGD